MVVGFGEVWEEEEERKKRRWRRVTSLLGRFGAARAPYERLRSYGMPSCALEPLLCLCIPYMSAYERGARTGRRLMRSDLSGAWLLLPYKACALVWDAILGSGPFVDFRLGGHMTVHMSAHARMTCRLCLWCLWLNFVGSSHAAYDCPYDRCGRMTGRLALCFSLELCFLW